MRRWGSNCESVIRTICDLINDPVNIQDTGFRILSYNKAAATSYGSGLEGQLCYEVLRNRKEVCPDCVLKKARATGDPAAVVQNLPGSPPRELTAYPVFDKEGKLFAFVEREKGDIHTQRPLPSEVLAGGIAHDFNNMLTSILHNLYLAKSYLHPSDRVFQKLANAEKASLMARQLTRQFLVFSKDDAPARKTTSVRKIVKETTSLSLTGHRVKCEYLLPESLWNVDVDEGQISQAIINIIINAAQAMPHGGTIVVSAENLSLKENKFPLLQEGRYVRLSIKDSGIGIPKRNLPKIFDPYFTTKQKGYGLGLASTYSLVTKNGGHIDVKSRQGVGTSFNIYLPAVKE